MRVAYILGAFPSLTTTFIDREIIEAQHQGMNLILVSMRKPPPFKVELRTTRLAEATKYLLPVSLPQLLMAHFGFLITQPRAYLTTLLYLLTRPHRRIGLWIRTLFYFIMGVWTAKILSAEGVEHIHAHFANRTTVVAMTASRLLGVPYSITAHAYDIYVSPVMLPAKIAGASFVATCTAYNRTRLSSIEGGRFADKIHLIYHGLDLTKFESTHRISLNQRRPLVLSVAQLKEKKGFPHLLKACRLLLDRGYDFKCEIVGHGSLRGELEQMIDKLDLVETVSLCGALPHSEVIAKYAQATLFALPCVQARNGDRDGIPNVLLEAMAMKIPVVSTQFSGIPEAVKDGRTGLLITPGDTEALADALARLLDDPTLREKLGKEGRKRVETVFDVRRNTNQLIKLFKESRTNAQ